MTRRFLLSLSFAVAVGAVAVVAAGVYAQGQTPKRGGILNTLLIEEPPGLLIHESATVSNVWPMSPCYSNLVLFRSRQAAGERGYGDSGTGRSLVVAGQLPQPRVLPQEEREVARRSPLQLARREVHLRRGARGAGSPHQTPAERAQGLVRQRGRHRGARSLHGGVQAQAPPAVASSHARLRLLARVSGART